MAGYLGDHFLNQHGPMDVEVFVEAFAGGAGAGLTLLDADVIDELWLVERHPALAAFWRYAVNDGDELAHRIESTVPTMAHWQHSREVVAAVDRGEVVDDRESAFAAFLVNRCSRSGIVADRAGVLGGRQQSGRWRITSRYNGPALASRVRRIAELSHRIRVIETDAIDYLAGLSDSGFGDEVMVFADPPYVSDGPSLYRHSFTAADHVSLALTLTTSSVRWMLTYDAHPLVLQLYPGYRILEYTIRHTANVAHNDFEYAVFSDNLAVDPAAIPFAGRHARWVTHWWASAEREATS